MPEPADPFGTSMEGTLTLHELYVSYVRAGFSEMQAYGLVQIHLAAVLARAE